MVKGKKICKGGETDNEEEKKPNSLEGKEFTDE